MNGKLAPVFDILLQKQFIQLVNHSEGQEKQPYYLNQLPVCFHSYFRKQQILAQCLFAIGVSNHP